MKRHLRENGLTLFFLFIFFVTLIGQAFAGHADYNNQLLADGLQPVSLARYLATSSFAVDVVENWQSEFLQFWLFIMATVWLVQKGSPESKPLSDIGTESDEDQLVGAHANVSSPRWAQVGGIRLAIYSNSLSLAMGAVFLLSWLVQSIAGHVAYNDARLAQKQVPLTWVEYLASADFWNRSLQNWQSEFLALASMVALSIYLRQRGSPESKPVGAPHQSTGMEG